MTTPRPFRFGVQATTAADGPSWMELARKVEATGFSALSIPDHLFGEQLAPVPALTAAAAATTTLRVGALVWDNDFKHPVILAKELATMDWLSGGRVEIGIGAGWELPDYQVSGIPFDRAGIRVDRLVEALGVIKGHFGGGSFSQAGEHYTVTELDGYPKSVQKPHPPILIGAGGKRMLGIAAREADIVGINPTLTAGEVDDDVLASMTAEAFDAKVAQFRAAAGDRLDQIELSNRCYVVSIDENVEQAVREIQQSVPYDLSREFLETTPFALVGPPSKLIEDILERRERWGISYVIVGPENVDDFAPVVAALDGK